MRGFTVADEEEKTPDEELCSELCVLSLSMHIVVFSLINGLHVASNVLQAKLNFLFMSMC